MEKVKRNGWKVAFLAVIALMCSHAIFGDANNWNPQGPPAPTMKSLDAIYGAVASLASPSISQREGYCRYVSCDPATTTTILTVPTGKRFVLRKLWVANGTLVWNISGGSNLYIDATIMITNASGPLEYELMWDFPDGCVVVEGGNSLTFTNTGGSSISTTFIGYFYDVP